jgi:predicted anti-sigma-YlaC factor YlaD
MNCLECQDLMQRRLDGEALLAPEMDAHLASCPECRIWQASSVRLLEGVQKLPAAKPPVGFSQRLTGLVLRAREQRRRRVRWVVGAAVAASILLILMLNGNRPTPDGPNPAADIAKKDPPPRFKETQGLNPTLDEVRTAVASLTDRVAKSTKENTQILLNVANPMDVAPQGKAGDAPLDAYVKTVSGAGQGVSDAVQPVTQSAQRAVTYFFRGIPPVAKTKGAN